MRCLMKLQPRAQFIVATHSPDIYDEARSDERHFLVPEDNPRARIWRPVQPIGAGACPIMSLDVAEQASIGARSIGVRRRIDREYLRLSGMMQASGSWWAAETRESAIVKDAKDAGFGNVFAVTDRDFRDLNQSEWDNPARSFRTFILPVHEIENISSTPRHCMPVDLAIPVSRCPGLNAQLEATALRLSWWAACREVVAELKRALRAIHAQSSLHAEQPQRRQSPHL